MTNPTDIAQSIIEEIFLNGASPTFQQQVVSRIGEEFGPEWVQTNANGNRSIHKDVQREFRKLKSPDIHWDRDSFSWNFEESETQV